MYTIITTHPRNLERCHFESLIFDQFLYGKSDLLFILSNLESLSHFVELITYFLFSLSKPGPFFFKSQFDTELLMRHLGQMTRLDIVYQRVDTDFNNFSHREYILADTSAWVGRLLMFVSNEALSPNWLQN